ncbi:MAG: biotin transporter BioY [Clostridia bacterium]|nr:biotin transporter BioY [Clostridia bacterium]
MTTRDSVYSALFTAVTAALGLVIIPMFPVPVTGQSMGPMLAGSALGSKRGFMSLTVFVLSAAVGVPILSGARGGLGVIMGPTGGYILSWPIAAYIIGKLREVFGGKSLLRCITYNFFGGVVIVYSLGVPWLSVLQGLSLKTALIEGALIFLPGDIVKVFLASFAAQAINRSNIIK